MRCGCKRNKSGMNDSKVFDLSNTDEQVTNLGKTKDKTSLGKKISRVLTILDLNTFKYPYGGIIRQLDMCLEFRK